MSNVYKRQADALAFWLAKGLTLKQAAERVARQARRFHYKAHRGGKR